MIIDPLTEEIRRENEDLKKKLAELTAAQSVQAPVDLGPKPEYRLLKPFYGPDDVYYDPEAGDEVIIWTGPPNHSMEPLNEQAVKRWKAWQESLPIKGDIPLEYIVEAAAKLRPRSGDEDIPLADFAGSIMREAVRMRNSRSATPAPEETVSLPHKEENVPAMGGGRTNRKVSKEIVAAVPQSPLKRGRQPKRVFGSGVNERPIEIG